MKIALSKLIIKNFKGIEFFELNLGGDSAMIAGKNGTGKTTLADAFYWLFSDQDSLGQAKFNLIELGRNGLPVDNQNAIVEAEIFIGSKAHIFKKIYRQKWTKKRGSMTAELTGHTTEYFFNGAPLSKTKYNGKLSQFGNFRVFSDVHFFCGRMKAEERRKILIELAGNGQSKDLKELIGDLTADEFRAMLLSKRRSINDQLNGMSQRIDELNQVRPKIDKLDRKALELELKATIDEIFQKKDEIISINSGLKINELKSELTQLHDERTLELESKSMQFKHEIKILKDSIARLLEENETWKKLKLEIVEEWKRVNAEKFVSKPVCFACKQSLPYEMIDTQKNEFYGNQANRLRKINEREDYLIGKIDANEQKILNYKMAVSNLETNLKVNTDTLDLVKTGIAARKAEIESQIEKIMIDKGPEIESINEAIKGLEKRKSNIEVDLLDFIQVEKIDAHIKAKKESLKEVAGQFEEIESKLNQLDEILKDMTRAIETKVNQYFEITSWKLFEAQINGGIREVCEPMLNGVPFSSDLNTGARINIGLDCIKTLSKHFGIELPVFIDNAESITQWQNCDDMQVIKLIARPDKEDLEVING